MSVSLDPTTELVTSSRCKDEDSSSMKLNDLAEAYGNLNSKTTLAITSEPVSSDRKLTGYPKSLLFDEIAFVDPAETSPNIV